MFTTTDVDLGTTKITNHQFEIVEEENAIIIPNEIILMLADEIRERVNTGQEDG